MIVAVYFHIIKGVLHIKTINMKDLQRRNADNRDVALRAVRHIDPGFEPGMRVFDNKDRNPDKWAALIEMQLKDEVDGTAELKYVEVYGVFVPSVSRVEATQRSVQLFQTQKEADDYIAGGRCDDVKAIVKQLYIRMPYWMFDLGADEYMKRFNTRY